MQRSLRSTTRITLAALVAWASVLSHAWFGLGFPAATPPEIVERMNREVATALATPELKQKLEAAGITPLAMSPAQFTELIKSDTVRWRTVINDARITTE